MNHQNSDGLSPLLLAAKLDNVEMAQLLLGEGKAKRDLVDKCGRNFLMTAIVHDASEIVTVGG